jgi:small subunit ribosomal protein S7
MPRRREVPKREILPDPKFGNVELSKFMNVIMEGGKKAVAERIIYGALELIQAGKDALEVFTVAINNVKPMVEVKSRRGRRQLPGARGSASVRRLALAMRWIKEGSQAWREVHGSTPGQRAAGSHQAVAALMKRRDEVHRMAEANKAFSHFRF